VSGRRHARAAAGALLLALALPSAVLLGSAAADPSETPSATESPTASPSATVTETPTATVTTTVTASPAPTGPFSVDDAQLRWGLNDESNNAAFAPGTFNFLSAGEVADPGAGGTTLPSTGTGATWSNGRPAGWAARSGEVRIEKRQAGGGYALATFAGTSTDAAGTRLTTSGGRFSDHQVVIDGGTGTVDPTAGTASVAWDGTFTVLYYSGMTFFTVSDPELRVTPTTAQLVGTVSGYASDMVDQTKWQKVPGQEVVLADLPRGQLQLPAEGGFSATPAYLGVRYDAPAGGVEQVRSGPSWGAFPSSYLDFMTKAGAAAYWYSSGGSADPHKVAKPITISYSAGDPITVPADPDEAKGGHGTKPTKTPSTSVAPEPPSPSATATASPSATAQPAGPALPDQSAGALGPPAAIPAAVAAQTFDPRLPGVPVVTALTSPAASEATSSGHPWEWWAGSLLLLGAAALTTLSTVSSLKGKS
jgi:hypothetical protein